MSPGINSSVPTIISTESSINCEQITTNGGVGQKIVPVCIRSLLHLLPHTPTPHMNSLFVQLLDLAKYVKRVT